MRKTKLTTKHFELFKKECLKWQNKFELNNWELFFQWQKKKGIRASVSYNIAGYIATFYLTKVWPFSEVTDNDIKIIAKHEMIHLLLGRLDSTGSTRYISMDESEEALEETVRKLETIIRER